MGRVIDSGGVFAPRLESKRIQQGRIPFSERLAEKYLSPTGIAQTATLIGAVPIPKAVSKYFMKEDKPEAESGAPAGPVLTPAQQVASQRVGTPPGGLGAGPTAREQGRGLLRTRREITPQEYEQTLIARATETPGFAGIPDAQLARQLAPGSQTDTPTYDISKRATDASKIMRGAALGSLPGMAPGGDLKTYQLQVEAVSRGLLSPQDFAASPGISRPGTAQGAVIERLRTEFGGTPVTTEERVMPTQEEYEASQAEEAPPAVAPPAAGEPTPIDPRFQADFPEAPPVTKAARFQKAVADAGFNKFGADMDFMRSVAKFADTEEEVKMVISAMDMVKVPPRTIGDLLTGAHEDRFRKEIMGLFPKLKAAEKPVSDLDKAKAGYYRAGTKLRGAQAGTEKKKQNKLSKETDKLDKLIKGIGGKGGSKQRKEALSRFDKQAAILNSNIDKQYTAKNDLVRVNKAEYTKLSDASRRAQAALKTALKSHDGGQITDEELTRIQTTAEDAGLALSNFNTRTGYEDAISEAADLRQQLSALNRLTADVAQTGRVNVDAWNKLKGNINLSGTSVKRRTEAVERDIKSKDLREQLEAEAKRESDKAKAIKEDKELGEAVQQRDKLEEDQMLEVLIPRYRDTELFKEDFRRYAKFAGVMDRSTGAYDNPRRVSEDDFETLLNYVSDDNPYAYLYELWKTNQLETEEERRERTKLRLNDR